MTTSVEPTPAERKAELLLRMQQQRERWRQQRDVTDDEGSADGDVFPRSRVFRFLLANPALAAAALGAVVAAGPARLMRWGAWLLPLLMRR